MNIATTNIYPEFGAASNGPPSAWARARASAGPDALRVAGAVERTLDLSRASRDVLGAILRLDAEELQDFLALTSELLKAGVVGREVVEVDGRPRETYVDARIADPALRGAPPYRRERLNLRA